MALNADTKCRFLRSAPISRSAAWISWPFTSCWRGTFCTPILMKRDGNDPGKALQRVRQLMTIHKHGMVKA